MNLFKHQQKIKRLSSATTTDGTQSDDITRKLLLHIDTTRAKKNGGGGGDIFKSYQYADATNEGDEALTDSIFNGEHVEQKF